MPDDHIKQTKWASSAVFETIFKYVEQANKELQNWYLKLSESKKNAYEGQINQKSLAIVATIHNR